MLNTATGWPSISRIRRVPLGMSSVVPTVIHSRFSPVTGAYCMFIVPNLNSHLYASSSLAGQPFRP